MSIKNDSTLTTEQETPVAAIPKKKRGGKDKIYRVSVKSSGEACSERALYTSIFESLMALPKDATDDEKGVAV